MKRNIFDKPKGIHDIFKDERYLYPEFVPERLPHRDAEIDALVYAFNPVLKGKKPINVCVLGPTGVGKTCVAKFVLNELEEFTDRAKGLYINCFEFNTRQSILHKITAFLGRAVPRRGIGTDEIYSMFLEALRKSDFIPVIVLDEADQLLYTDANKVLYDLLRVVEHQKNRLGVISLSNNLNFTAELDARIKSSLAEERIVFNPYTPQQLKDILNERAQYAFHGKALGKDVVNVAAAHAAKKGGDARVAIEALLKAGRLAEKENAEEVSLEHLRRAFDLVEAVPAQKVLKHLGEAEKELLKLLSKEKNAIASGELYEKFNQKKKTPLTERRLRSLVSRLQTLNLVKADLKEARGKTRMIALNISPELVKKELK